MLFRSRQVAEIVHGDLSAYNILAAEAGPTEEVDRGRFASDEPGVY